MELVLNQARNLRRFLMQSKYITSLSRKGLKALLRHLHYFPGPYIAKELNMRRDDVEELAMRGLENLDQYEQTNRPYVLAAEAPRTCLSFAETRTSAHRESYYIYLPPSQLIDVH